MREHQARHAGAVAAVMLVAVGPAGPCACSGRGSADTARPTSADASGPDLDDVRARIHELVGRGLPSIAVAVVADGRIHWEAAFGWEDVAARRPATVHTRYPIGSVSKPFAATAIMILSDRGAIDLGAPANRYLGRARLIRHDGDADEATVRDLLQHRAGLPSPHVTRFYQGEERKPPPVEEALRRYGVIVDPPGRRFGYSNLGYGALGHIVSRVSGVDLGRFLAREVFAPLGMRDTTLEAGAAPSPPSATLYQDGEALPAYCFDEAASGRIWSSAHDLARFALYHLGRRLPDQRAILSEASRLAMATDARPSGKHGGTSEWFYSLGWSGRDRSEHNAERWYGHDGGVPGALSELRLIPDRGLAVIVLTNDTDAPTKEILELILDAMIPSYTWARREDPAAHSGPASVRFAAPADLRGIWTGEIRTWSDSVPVRLEIRRRSALIRVGSADPVALDALEMFEGRLRGRSPGRLPSPDLDGQPYELWYELRRERGQLVGAAFAADTARLRHFVLPSWMRLRRQPRLEWQPESWDRF